jgi:hypothetical protein
MIIIQNTTNLMSNPAPAASDGGVLEVPTQKLAFGDRYRPREAGTGYGASSGYASSRRYADSSAPRYFSCG